MPLVFVMFGGALGAGARYLTGRATLALFGPGFPVGTLAVNVIGGLLMGVLAGVLARNGSGGEPWRLFLGVGVLGGFTTFSSFSLDVVGMIERGAPGAALFYILLSVIGSVLALFAGLMMTRSGGTLA
ncbi:fluoride efflux transporter CrcB [Sphingomonadaceae bacterium OTU29THOMA1]|nr:fluoride efflux transporter CrcB [Sphingomonadaceae bacterium OTU29THOMA1]